MCRRPPAGVVKSVAVKKGDRVSKGSVIARACEASSSRVSAEAARRSGSRPKRPASPAQKLPKRRRSKAQRRRRICRSQPPQPATASPHRPRNAAAAASSYDFDVVVLGAGPGGYTAAFRAADLGMKVALIERWPQLGGVCLNVGCIPSKALLHAAKVIDEAEEMAQRRRAASASRRSMPRSCATGRTRSSSRLTGGLATMAKQRKVEVIRGVGKFVSPHEIEIVDAGSGAARVGRSSQASRPRASVAFVRPLHHRRGL